MCGGLGLLLSRRLGAEPLKATAFSQREQVSRRRLYLDQLEADRTVRAVVEPANVLEAWLTAI